METKLTIVFDGKDVKITAVGGVAVAGGPVARVGFVLTEDPVPKPKRRAGESADDYAGRVALVLPDAVQVPAEYFAGVRDRCQEIAAGLEEILRHYATRAGMEHALLAAGQSPPGVKTLKVGGGLGPAADARPRKAVPKIGEK